MGKKLIDFIDITKSYNGNVVLDDLNLYIRENEFLTLLGPSGCGKTTTLRMLGGFETPDKGKIMFDSKDITNMPANERNLNTVFQKYSLFPHMTIKENIELVAKLEKVPELEREERVKELMDMVGLPYEKFADRYPKQLSGGQQQRVGIARAFMTNPDIILMDEPFSALDPITRSQLQDELINIQTQYKKTIIFVSHDMDEAVKIADKICIMGTGKVIQHDDPETILKNPANDFVSNFVGKNRIWSSPEYIKVKDIMLDNPITCSAEMSLFKCVRKMRHERVDSLLVIDRKGKFEGIITGKLIQKEKDHYKTVREILETPEFTTGPENSIIDVLKEVNENKLSSLPVVDENGILRGIITKTSLVTTLSQQFDITVN